MATNAIRSTVLVLAIGVTGACSAIQAPTAPDGASATSTATTASILGALITPSGSAMSGVVVSVVGVGKAARSDSTGKFGLSRVPVGNLQLQFTGPGVDASLMLPHVTPSEAIDITISLDGNSATISISNRTKV
jgi:hypothetical protein